MQLPMIIEQELLLQGLSSTKFNNDLWSERIILCPESWLNLMLLFPVTISHRAYHKCRFHYIICEFLSIPTKYGGLSGDNALCGHTAQGSKSSHLLVCSAIEPIIEFFEGIL